MIHSKIKNLNFLQQEVRYKKIAEQISNKLLQSIIINMLIDDVCYDAPNAFCHEKMHIDNLSYDDDFPINIPIQDLMISSCHYFTNDFRGNIHSTKMLNTINYPNIINDSLQESDNDVWINTTNKWDNNSIHIYTTSKWIIMEKKNKGKSPTQDYSQKKRLPAGPFAMAHLLG